LTGWVAEAVEDEAAGWRVPEYSFIIAATKNAGGGTKETSRDGTKTYNGVLGRL